MSKECGDGRSSPVIVVVSGCGVLIFVVSSSPALSRPVVSRPNVAGSRYCRSSDVVNSSIVDCSCNVAKRVSKECRVKLLSRSGVEGEGRKFEVERAEDIS